MLTGINLQNAASFYRCAVIELRYAADQFERCARSIEDRRYDLAEDCLRRAFDGMERVSSSIDAAAEA